MLHSGCVKLHQKFRDFVGLPMGLLREESPKNRMNTGLFGSRSGEYGLKAARRAPQFSRKLAIKKQLCQGRAAKFAIRVKSALRELRCTTGSLQTVLT